MPKTELEEKNDDVKAYLPHHNDFESAACSDILEDDGADMFSLLCDMREWIEVKFGYHVPISMRADNEVEIAQYHFRDPRTGKSYRFTICKEDEEPENE